MAPDYRYSSSSNTNRQVIPVSSTEISNLVTYPTGRPTSTTTIYIKKPTWTPPPIETPLLIKISTRPPTPKPNPTLFAAIPAPANPDCSAQYTYIEAMHQYDIDYINYTYNPEISYYQSLYDQASQELDALTMVQIQRYIDQIKAQRDAAINSENSRYEADHASLDAQCG